MSRLQVSVRRHRTAVYSFTIDQMFHRFGRYRCYRYANERADYSLQIGFVYVIYVTCTIEHVNIRGDYLAKRSDSHRNRVRRQTNKVIR